MSLLSTGLSIAGGAVGTLLAPGVGTGIGASLGGMLGSAIDGGDSQASHTGEGFNDELRQEQINTAQGLLKSHVGADIANSTSRRLLNRAKLNSVQMQNNPAFSGNAAVQNAGYNQQMEGVANGVSDAAVSGAQIDQQAKEKGAQLMAGQQTMDYADFNRRHTEQMQPNGAQTLISGALGNIAGAGSKYLSSKLFPTDTGGGDSNGFTGDTGTSLIDPTLGDASSVIG